MNSVYKKSFKTIKEFDYKGYICLVVQNSHLKYLLGYVKLPKGHKYYNVPIEEIPVDCHYGLTYGEIQDNYYVIGFDCAHSNDFDIPKKSLYSLQNKTDRLNITDWFPNPNKDENFVTDNIKGIVDQLERE